MENINIAAMERSPEVDFNFTANTFLLKGESYPEDISVFYGPVIGKLEEHLGSISGAKVHFAFELIYFNSSTAKVLMGLFEILDETAAKGNEVLITWAYEEDDDNMEEMGEEFGEDLENAAFELKRIAIK